MGRRERSALAPDCTLLMLAHQQALPIHSSAASGHAGDGHGSSDSSQAGGGTMMRSISEGSNLVNPPA